MKNLISVLTAVHGPAVPYLRDAYASLVSQEMPPGWGWKWIVQEDGETGAVATAAMPSDSRISIGAGRSGGPGVARTLALSRATGSLLKVLDADDQLTPGALARDIEILTSHPNIGWTTAKALDLMPDGTTVGWNGDPPNGPLSGPEVFSFWLDHDYRLPMQPATLCIRRDLALALGGWMALPASEDTGLLLAANVVSTGYFIAKDGLLYRKWPGQVTASSAHVDPTERLARMAVIEARVRALQDLLPRYSLDKSA